MPPPPPEKAVDYETALEEVKEFISSGKLLVKLMQPGAVFAVNANDPEE